MIFNPKALAKPTDCSDSGNGIKLEWSFWRKL